MKSENKLLTQEKFKKAKVFLIYTLIFGIIELFLILVFKKYDKQFIWNADGLDQHIVNLKYFRELLLEFLKTGHLSTFTWNVGAGFNLFSNFAYYLFGDFFSYLTIFFSEDKIELAYNMLIVIRMYFIGIAFLAYCKYKRTKEFPALIGALMYTFCGYALFSVIRHPYFANALILFPLVMIGIEKAILENKYIFYTIIIAIAFIGNFYFAYMIALIIAIYGIILAIHTYKEDGIKKIINVLLKVVLYSILGITISGVIILPTAFSFLSSERSWGDVVQTYSIAYYKNLASNLINTIYTDYWAILEVQSIILLAIPVFIKRRKENYPIFILMLILILPLLFSRNKLNI